MSDSTSAADRVREVTAKDLPLFCPTPDMPLWAQHPRVFLPIEAEGEVLCPYCGYRYVLKGGPGKPGH
jgi:uncharacterized Zn-finger protein